ncbi:MAG: hypothetical protein NZ960_06090 [Candidatus Kapabacteria bacterium]|nr:hypothetical protein [Candidatus Kapabacteria bacterium]MDW8012545.1 hypothetical protein [Bacteroidota bacterium]
MTSPGWLLLAGALSLTVAEAQIKVVTLLRGTVVDRQTGTPVGTEFEVRDANGKLVQQGRSDSRRGTFELVLTPGQRYLISFRGYNVLRQTDTVDVPPSDQYTELSQTFRVQVLRPGMELLRIHAFDPGSTTLRPSAHAALNELKELLNRNRSLRVNVHIAILDTRLIDEPAPPQRQRWEKRQSRATVPPAPTPTLLERAQRLLEARADAVRRYLMPNVRDAEERIRITPEIPPLPIVRPIPEAPTVTVFVDQVRDLLE